MEFGHISPIFMLPIGCWGLIDAPPKQVAITEAAVIQAPWRSSVSAGASAADTQPSVVEKITAEGCKVI